MRKEKIMKRVEIKITLEYSDSDTEEMGDNKIEDTIRDNLEYSEGIFDLGVSINPISVEKEIDSFTVPEKI